MGEVDEDLVRIPFPVQLHLIKSRAIDAIRLMVNEDWEFVYAPDDQKRGWAFLYLTASTAMHLQQRAPVLYKSTLVIREASR